MIKKFLAAKKNSVGIAVLTTIGIFNLSFAGIPVIDATNVVQTTVSAAKSAAMVAKQIQEYQAQLQQLEIQIRDNLAPAAYLWDQAQGTMQKLMGAVNTLEYYKRQLGSVDNFLNKFQDVNYYRNSPCFKLGGQCTAEERALLERTIDLASESQTNANKAMFKALEDQQKQITVDARRLEELQKNAQGSQGQLEAIGFATQIASHQSNQLLQIRGLLIAQQNAIATQMQAQLDKEAKQQVIAEKVRKNTFQKSPPKAW